MGKQLYGSIASNKILTDESIKRTSDKIDSIQENFKGEMETMQHDVSEEQEKTRLALGQTVLMDTFSKAYEVMKTSYDKVASEHALVKGEIQALKIRIESKMNDITKELEQGGRAAAVPRAPESFPDLSTIGATSPPRAGQVETPVCPITGRIAADNDWAWSVAIHHVCSLLGLTK